MKDRKMKKNRFVVMALRQRLKKVVSLKTVKILDGFPKVEDAIRENSPIGGTVSLFSYILMVWLMISETSYYFDSDIIYKFLPDVDIDAKLPLYVDITVAMPCATVGADILDSTSQNLLLFGELQEEDTWFELDPVQRKRFEQIQNLNSHLREQFHFLHDGLWKSHGYIKYLNIHDNHIRKTFPARPYDACRIHGKLTLNKVAGNFHVSAGKSLQLPGGHVHIAAFISERDYNFSHRIDRFSFGEYSPGIIHPLEGDEEITTESRMLFQYFIQVIPTEVDTFFSRQLTYQYSVRNHQRPIDHYSGSHGIPGVFFKYDMSALKVRVLQEQSSLISFIVKLCATVGGIYWTSGIVNSITQYFIQFFRCKYFRNDVQ